MSHSSANSLPRARSCPPNRSSTHQAHTEGRSISRRRSKGSGIGQWHARLLSALAVRRNLGTGENLFALGDPARRYFLVETGCLVLHRRSRWGGRIHRFAGAGDLIIFDCGGDHVATCTALDDCRVLSIERQRLELFGRQDPGIARLLRETHARELAMLLESLGAEQALSRDRDFFPATEPGQTHWRLLQRALAAAPSHGVWTA